MMAGGIETILVLDFEATCDDAEPELTRLQQTDIHEIIDFPVVRIAARDKDDGTKAGQEIDHFHAYVRPAAAPTGEPRQLSEFCTSLTHITQSEVDVASPLDEVLEQLEAWLQERGLVQALEQGSAVLVAHGEWDLRDQLPRECARKGITLPSYFNTHTDLKTVFALTHTAHRGTSLKQMADFSGIKLEGRAHCGLDDCRNFGRIIAGLLHEGADFSPTFDAGPGVVRGQGAGALMGDWLCSCGVVCFGKRAKCYRCGEPRPDDAADAVPEVSAAGNLGSGKASRVGGNAQASAASARPRRPGDWDCPGCKAVVFASKLRCFRCAAPRPPHLQAASFPRTPPRRLGDWDCPNPACRALVFASKSVCFRCGTAPMAAMYGDGSPQAMGHYQQGYMPQGGVVGGMMIAPGGYPAAGGMMGGGQYAVAANYPQQYAYATGGQQYAMGGGMAQAQRMAQPPQQVQPQQVQPQQVQPQQVHVQQVHVQQQQQQIAAQQQQQQIAAQQHYFSQLHSQQQQQFMTQAQYGQYAGFQPQ